MTIIGSISRQNDYCFVGAGVLGSLCAGAESFGAGVGAGLACGAGAKVGAVDGAMGRGGDGGAAPVVDGVVADGSLLATVSERLYPITSAMITITTKIAAAHPHIVPALRSSIARRLVVSGSKGCRGS